jgi:formyl-CoA transferase
VHVSFRHTAHDDGEFTMPLALEHMTVIDLTQVMAGPFCCQLLGDLGADVIKVEPVGRGDATREATGHRLPHGESAAFLAVNRNKRSIAIDLRSAAGLAAFHRLVRDADVVVESFRPGVAGRLGVGYPALREINARLVYASISGFGQTGPYAARPGYDLIAQAMSGVMSVTGDPAGDPVKCGVPVADLSAGLLCAVGILGACLSRTVTGRGQAVDTSLYDAALAMSVWETSELWATGEPPGRLGSAHRVNAPYEAFPTRDGHLTIGANNARLWARLCAVLGRPGLLDDPRFATNTDRVRNRAELAAELGRSLSERDTDEWVGLLLDAGVPAGPIRDYRQACEDPHTLAREMVVEMDHPGEGTVRALGIPVKLSETAGRAHRRDPARGRLHRRGHRRVAYRGVGGMTIDVHISGPVATATVNRPAARNAMTMAMYDALAGFCERVDDSAGVRVAVVRGTGGKAFVSGTDINHFRDFRGAGDGIAYERRIEGVLARLEQVAVPTVAVVDGYATGGGLSIAAACDLRICTPAARFGLPIARTLGNCVSMPTYARLVHLIGAARTAQLIYTAGFIDAADAVHIGLASELVTADRLDARVDELCTQLASQAPLTMRASKVALRRLRDHALPPDEDLVSQCYGSDDFAEGVAAFLDKRPPRWRGR